MINKVAVPALDSPCFIANRVGVHAMMATLRIAKDMNLTVEEVDALTGPLLGRPKTATFKLADLVGLDTLAHIVNGLKQAFPNEIFDLDPAAGRDGQERGHRPQGRRRLLQEGQGSPRTAWRSSTSRPANTAPSRRPASRS